MKFACDGNKPISSSTSIRTGGLVIEQNELFPIACCEWRACTQNNHTMVDLVTHFRQVDREHNRFATTKQTGYHAANAVIQPWAGTIKNGMGKMELNNDAPFMTTPAAFSAAVSEAATGAPEPLITPRSSIQPPLQRPSPQPFQPPTKDVEVEEDATAMMTAQTMAETEDKIT